MNLSILKSFVFFFILIFPVVSIAQVKQTKTVKGKIIDSITKKPLSHCTVVLLNPATKSIQQSIITGSDGFFQFSAVQCQPLALQVSLIGYRPFELLLKEDCDLTDIKVIQLSTMTNGLKEVNIVSVKSIIKQDVDRLVYNVQADPDSKALSVLELLRKVPLISVDGTDNIQLKGNSDFRIFLNGKPSALLVRNPSDVLRAMPAINIEKIEVITTPPAKYDAEGLAGIINIITKRNTSQGYNVNLTARYNSVYGPNVNVNGTIKEGKLGVVGYYGYNNQKNQITYVERKEDYFSSNSFLNQNTTNSKKGNNNYGSMEFSYEIDSLNLLYSNVNFYQGILHSGNLLESSQVNQLKNLLQSYTQSNIGSDSNLGLDVSINYQLGFKNDKNKLFTASYKFSYSPNKSFNNVETANGFNFANLNYNQNNRSGLKEQTMQIDYAQSLKNCTIETGIKGIFRNNFSDFFSSNFNPAQNSYLVDLTQTDNFYNNQNVFSTYGSYQLKLSKWNLKGGLRLENTRINADFISTESELKYNYSNLIPSLSVQRTFKSFSLNLGYSNRISRPSIYQLNPFVNKSNPLFVFYGNPNLSPVLNHNFNLTYSYYKKVQVNMGLGYSFINNAVESLSTLLNRDTTITTFENIGKNKNVNYYINLNYPISSKWNLTFNGAIQHLWLSGYFNQLSYRNSGLQGSVSVNSSYKLSDTWRIGFNSFYNSPALTLQRRLNSYFYSAYSLSKDIFNKKVNISFFANNPYSKYITTNSYTYSPQFSQVNHNKNYYAIYNVNLSYKFGKLNNGIKKNQHGINNDDLSGNK